MEEFSKDFDGSKSPEMPHDDPDSFDNFEDLPEPSQNPVKEIKPGLIVGVLAVLTITGLFFTVSNWFDSLRIPFAKNSSLAGANLNSDSLDLANNDVANLLALKQKDTDQDSLTDYDELYLYKTSPYIPDSDSDGYADGEEVKNSQDPNCPAGLSCASLTLPADQSGPVLPDNMDALTPDQIRSLLLQSGVSAEELKNISDEELKNLYQQAVLQGQSETNNDGGLADLKPADYQAITPEQLRALLMDQGANEEDLQDLADADLRQLWDQVLIEAQAQANTTQP